MPTSRQTLLFSATMPKALAQFARAGLKSPELVRLDADTKLSPDLQSFYFTIRHDDKPAGLLFLVEELIPRGQPTVVFVATRHSVEFLVGLLAEEGIESAFVHGSMDQVRELILTRGGGGEIFGVCLFVWWVWNGCTSLRDVP